MRLPVSLEDLRGLRAARWIRESTTGQFDSHGPEAQREQQRRAIERYGLKDTGIEWMVAHSGYRKGRDGLAAIASSDQWREMLDRAGRDYDVLVIGYVSRFVRDTEVQFTTRRMFHQAGAVILFADERILTSDEDAWDSWAREAVEAESYSRKLARRIREGYAAKRRRLGEPGGRPPFGFVRQGRPPQLRPNDDLVPVRTAFSQAGRGDTDRAIAAALRLPIDTVRSTLTNPIYIGLLRDGTPAAVEPIIDRATWDRVQALRASRSARGGYAARNRTYLIPMLRCAFCDRRMVGDSGRYRHLEPCAAFIAARPSQRYRNRLIRRGGQSYAAEVYEAALNVGVIEGARALGERLYVRSAEAYTEPPAVDELALRRVDAERERAMSAYRAHRDPHRLELDMANLDAKEQAIREQAPVEVPWAKVLEELRRLPDLWAKASREDQRAIASEMFLAAYARGGRELTLDFWHGAQVVIGVGAKGFEPVLSTVRAPWSTEASA